VQSFVPADTDQAVSEYRLDEGATLVKVASQVAWLSGANRGVFHRNLLSLLSSALCKTIADNQPIESYLGSSSAPKPYIMTEMLHPFAFRIPRVKSKPISAKGYPHFFFHWLTQHRSVDA
jgi:hypothetical protein